jgi:hypothetical protein
MAHFAYGFVVGGLFLAVMMELFRQAREKQND